MDQIIKDKLKQLEPTSEQFWNIPPESGNHLNLIIKAAGYKNIIEVGTSNGYSAIWFAEAVRQTGGKVTGIEFSENRLNQAENNINECGLSDYVNIKQGRALDVLNDLDECEIFDLAFIDANKADYINYYNILDKKLRSGGLMVADNVTSHQEKMQDFLDAIDNNPDYQVSYLPFGGGLLLGLKK